MNMVKVLFPFIVLVGSVRAYGGAGGGGFGAMGGGYGGGIAEVGPAKPYSFGYETRNEHGGGHFHKEQGDGAGVRGSYGYTDKQGLHRVVDYVADGSGFHANVKTNEPGTDGKESPADVKMMANPVSAGMYGGGFGGGFGGKW